MPYYWINQNILHTLTITFQISEHRVARCLPGGHVLNWHVNGHPIGGVNAHQLWLYGAENQQPLLSAHTQFINPSPAVAFVMDGDHNDGIAEFFVDQNLICEHNLYNLGNQIMVVHDLENFAHRIEVRLTGRKVPDSEGYDAHICGGLALVPI